MRNDNGFYVYILTNRHRTVLYTGVTNDLRRRVAEHRDGSGSAFTSRYRTHRLVFAEEFRYIHEAIAAEKRIKGWSRRKKVRLIEEHNADWKDLSESSGVFRHPAR